MILPVGPFRPNTAKVERLVAGGVSNAGDPITGAPQTIYNGIPCLVDMMPRGGDIVEAKVGPVISQVYTLYIDGVPAPGVAPGASVDVTIGAVTYAFIVAPNGRGAFADIQQGDRVTDETGRVFQVAAVARYYDVAAGLQAHLRIGEGFG